MIDKLEVRVPRHTPYRAEFADLLRNVAYDPKNNPLHPSKHYVSVGDLRPFGHDAILHAGCKHGDGDSKLELVDTGKHSYAGMLHSIEQVFDTNPGRLEVMRVDLCADVVGTPVRWFKRQILANYKRWLASVGEFSEMGKSEIQTVYLGKRPNCYRIYDKTAEYLMQYERELRAHRRQARALDSAAAEAVFGDLGDANEEKVLSDASELPDLPSFESLYGVATDAVMTRVERQMGAGRVPEKIGSVQRLRKADHFNPFERLTLYAPGIPEPKTKDYDLGTFAIGMLIRQQCDEKGIQEARNWLNRNFGRHGSRLFKRYAEFLPDEQGDELGRGVSTADIYEIYRESVQRQLAA